MIIPISCSHSALLEYNAVRIVKPMILMNNRMLSLAMLFNESMNIMKSFKLSSLVVLMISFIMFPFNRSCVSLNERVKRLKRRWDRLPVDIKSVNGSTYESAIRNFHHSAMARTDAFTLCMMRPSGSKSEPTYRPPEI